MFNWRENLQGTVMKCKYSVWYWLVQTPDVSNHFFGFTGKKGLGCFKIANRITNKL